MESILSPIKTFDTQVIYLYEQLLIFIVDKLSNWMICVTQFPNLLPGDIFSIIVISRYPFKILTLPFSFPSMPSFFFLAIYLSLSFCSLYTFSFSFSLFISPTLLLFSTLSFLALFISIFICSFFLFLSRTLFFLPLSLGFFLNLINLVSEERITYLRFQLSTFDFRKISVIKNGQMIRS